MIKVGVALPIYNAINYIEQCLYSLVDQTYPVTIYMVDDASTDSRNGYTVHDFLSSRLNNWLKGHVLERNEENLGWPKTLNKAAKLAIDDGCDVIFNMNADDWLRIDAIAKMINALKNNCDWVNCYGQQVGGPNVIMESKENLNIQDFMEATPLTSWGLIRSEAWQDVGGYSEDVYIDDSIKAGYEDWEFWLKMYKAGKSHVVVKEPLYFYRMHPDQLHIKTTGQHELARQKILNKHNLL